MNPRKLASAALFAASMITAGSVSAFPLFTVDPTGYGGNSVFNADKITGGYEEKLTIIDGTTFDVALSVNFGQFFNTNISSANPIVGTGIANDYQLYAFFIGSGTYSTVGTTTNFVLNPGGALSVYLDPNADTVINSPMTGSSPYTTSSGADDLLFANGLSVTGNGSVSCSGSNNCGSFGQTTSFNLTPAGAAFFTAPVPFYEIAITTGQFNGFPIVVGETSTLNGSADTVFQRVPEPASIALVGLALVGLGFMRRRNQA